MAVQGIFDLPHEIRDMIYIHALSPPQHRYFFGVPVFHFRLIDRIRYWPQGKIVVPGKSLLLVNKQMYSESVEVLYGKFRFFIEDEVPTFLSIIGKVNASRLRYVMINAMVGCNHSPVESPSFNEHMREALNAMARSCTELKTLEVILDPNCDMRWVSYYTRLVDPLLEIDRWLVRALPSPPQTIASIDGMANLLRTCMRATALRRAKSLGWEVVREHRHLSSYRIRYVDVYQNFDVDADPDLEPIPDIQLFW